MQKKFVIFFLLCIVSLTSVFQDVETVKADYYNKDAYFQNSLGQPMSLYNKTAVANGYNVWFDTSAKSITFNGSPIYSRGLMAMTGWNKTAGAVKLSETTSKTASLIRVYSGYEDEDYAGQARPTDVRGIKCTDQSVLFCSKDWSTVDVFINHYAVAEWNSVRSEFDPSYMDYYDMYKVIAHEMGHAFGLVHQPANTKSVMISGQTYMIGDFADAQTLDLNNLNYMY